MNWLLLITAGLLEIGWAVGLKYTYGFTKLWPSLGTIGAMLVSIGLLGIAVKSLPISTAYAVWVGIGAVGTVGVGIFLGESAGIAKLISIFLIISGIVGLKLSS